MQRLAKDKLYNMTVAEQDSFLPYLRLQWLLLLLIATLALTSGYYALDNAWERAYSLRWLILAMAGSGYVLWSVWEGLAHNHHPSERRLFTGLGLANYVTVLRGLMIAAALGFCLSPMPPGRLAWAPAVLYTLAAISDLLDGYLARSKGRITRLGEILDMRFDGLGVLIASILAFQYGKVPAIYLLVGLARYLFLGGIWLRSQLGYNVYNLPKSPSRRTLAGIQMVFLFSVLWPISAPPATSILAILIAIPFLLGFLRDWLSVSGALRAPRDERT